MSSYLSWSTARNRINLLPAGILLVVAFAGIVHSARAAVAHILYYQTRYINEQECREDPEYASRQCRKACNLYPYNYYFLIWTAENSYYYRFDPQGKEIPSRLEDAAQWCDAGLAMNSWKSQLRFLKARLMARKEPLKAAEYVREYVDWDFWDPFGHSVLVEFYAQAGEIEKARSELKWVTGSKHYNFAAKEIELAEEARAEMPPAADPK